VRHPFFDLPRPLVIGHRGSSGEAPENTLPAFARALAQGAAILETDVHATRDGVVVVYHDERVERTTDGAGAIAELDFAALRALDAGYRYSPDGGASFPFRGKGLRIATLAEAFDAFPQARFNVEIKRDDPALVEGTVEAVAAAKREDRTLLTAGSDAAMARLRRCLRETALAPATGASTGDVIGFVRAATQGGAPPRDPDRVRRPSAGDAGARGLRPRPRRAGTRVDRERPRGDAPSARPRRRRDRERLPVAGVRGRGCAALRGRSAAAPHRRACRFSEEA
jgi:glycerophosphoryl diester phosphodiesterase